MICTFQVYNFKCLNALWNSRRQLRTPFDRCFLGLFKPVSAAPDLQVGPATFAYTLCMCTFKLHPWMHLISWRFPHFSCLQQRHMGVCAHIPPPPGCALANAVLLLTPHLGDTCALDLHHLARVCAVWLLQTAALCGGWQVKMGCVCTLRKPPLLYCYWGSHTHYHTRGGPIATRNCAFDRCVCAFSL